MIDKETVKRLVRLCKLIDKSEEQTKILFKVVDKLENRIKKLEIVLASHAKCIGELRVKDNQFEINADGTETKKDSIL